MYADECLDDAHWCSASKFQRDNTHRHTQKRMKKNSTVICSYNCSCSLFHDWRNLVRFHYNFLSCIKCLSTLSFFLFLLRFALPCFVESPVELSLFCAQSNSRIIDLNWMMHCFEHWRAIKNTEHTRSSAT